MRAGRYETGSEGKFASRWRAKSPDALCAVLPLVSSENFPECEPDDPYEKCQQNQFYHVQNPPRFKMLSYPVFGNADHQNDQHDHAHNSHDFSSPFHIRRSPKMTLGNAE